MNNRDFSIDVLRTIGICLIILAHVNPVNIIFQLRNFDVPFMVILSGYLFSKSSQNINSISKKYLYKRFKRLVFPVWIFLIILFTFMIIVRPSALNIKLVLGSFFLLNGIGYVWIIRIYLLVAIFGPYLLKKIGHKNELLKIIIIYCLYELLFFYYQQNFENSILEQTIFYTVPYILLFCYGSLYEKFTKKDIKKIIIFSLMICILGLIYSYYKYSIILNLQNYKYPARLYYIFYAILMANLLLENKNKFNFLEELKIKNLIIFVGNSTMWIYLWHISLIMGIELLKERNIYINGVVRYFLVLLGSIGLTYMQRLAISYILDNKVSEKNIKENIQSIFFS